MLKLFVAFPILAAVARIIAQVESDGGNTNNPWLQVLQWGPPGVVLVLLGTGQLRFNREVKDKDTLLAEEKVARVKAEEWKDEQQKYNQDKVIPLLADVNRTLVEVGRVLQISPPPKAPYEQALSDQLQALTKSIQQLKGEQGEQQ